MLWVILLDCFPFKTSSLSFLPLSSLSLCQCLTADTLAVHSISEQSRLDGVGLQQICPTMLQQLEMRTCTASQDQLADAEPILRPTDGEGTAARHSAQRLS